MYPPQPPPNMSELQGQGTQFHNAAPNRPELAGQYGYAPPPQQQQPYPSPTPSQHPHQMQGYASHQPGAPVMYGQQHPQASWQSGPVPDLHEMDAGGYGAQQR
jgi:hypothetical protein